MTKKELIDLLLKLEESIVSDSFEELWSENLKFVKCWEVLSCNKKSCPAYGRTGVRCWQVAGTFCKNKKFKGSFVKKWQGCLNCPVYKNVMDSEEVRVRELINNIIFALKNYDPASLNTLRIKKYFPQIVEEFKVSNREQAVLLLILERMTRKEISTHLTISEETVKMHTKNLYKKLAVSSRNDIFEKLSSFCEKLSKTGRLK